MVSPIMSSDCPQICHLPWNLLIYFLLIGLKGLQERHTFPWRLQAVSPSVFKVFGSLKCKSSDFTTHYLPCCHLQSCLTPPSFIDDFSTWLTVFLPIASPVTLGDFDILGDGPSPTPSFLHSLSCTEPMVLSLVPPYPPTPAVGLHSVPSSFKQLLHVLGNVKHSLATASCHLERPPEWH